MTLLLSLLIPTLPERIDKLRELLNCIPAHKQVEILALMDNRHRSLPAKRNALVALARGRYIAHIDDDELLSPDYLEFVLPELEHRADLVAYDAGVSFNGSPEFRVRTMLGAAIEHPSLGPDGRYSDIRRPPWMWCAWRADFARQFSFNEDVGYGEDWTFLEKALPAVKTWRKIDRVLFHHRWSASGTTFPVA